jgi:hypothetical protein
MNSTLIGNLINIGRNKVIDFKFITEYVEKAKQLGIYPIRSSSLSIKSTILILVLNVRWLYHILVRLFRILH